VGKTGRGWGKQGQREGKGAEGGDEGEERGKRVKDGGWVERGTERVMGGLE
jgi:hypothetical protein